MPAIPRSGSALAFARRLLDAMARSASLEGGLAGALAVLCRFTVAPWGALVVPVSGGVWIECTRGEPGKGPLDLPRDTALVRRARRIALPGERSRAGGAAAEPRDDMLAFPLRSGKRPAGYGVLAAVSPDRAGLRMIDVAGSLIGSFCASRAGRPAPAPHAARRSDAEVDFLMRLNAFQQSAAGVGALFGWICDELPSLLPIEAIEMATLAGEPGLWLAGSHAAIAAQGSDPGSRVRAGARAMLARAGCGEAAAHLGCRTFRLPAPPQARGARANFVRWTWESPLRFGERTLGVIAIRLRGVPAMRVRAERVLAAVSGLIGCFVHGLDEREKIRSMAMHDCLTGLFNYRAFVDLFRREFERYLRHGRTLSLVMLDLDNFKEVNDTFGHQAGDRLLQTAADIIRKSLRKTDFAFRYGGDEFAILMAETDARRAAVLADRLRQAFAREIRALHPAVGPLTASIGIADCSVLASHTAEELLARSDTALYEAKNAGRNRIRIASGAALSLPRAGSATPFRETARGTDAYSPANATAV